MGMWWTRTHTVVSAAGEPVEADVVDANALSAPMQRALRRHPVTAPPVEAATPPPQPLPEPRPEDAPVQRQVKAQEPVPVPDTIDQERVDRDALSAQTREREQEEKRRQEQIDLTERERQDEAEKRQRLARQADLQRQLADIRKQRAQASKEAQLAEQKLQQLADARARNPAQSVASASPPAGNNGVDRDLAARYAAALQEAILRNWTRPDSVPQGQRCKLNIRQLPGGEVIDVQVAASCPYDDLGKRSVEAAVLKAQPLPYAGFEAVFNRNLTVNFEAQDR
ncbi:TonB C-terminal domain-containing protein [Cognatiluteimonas profundi]|uniref:TonB C-terminal domain-containing protein n=1 Tax=Cognatiluteimonas profundi TaxID=2594501 RepID=UPI00131BF948